MSNQAEFQSEDIQRLENVLADTPMPALTRRGLIGKAAAGAATVGALGALGPVPSAFAHGRHHRRGWDRHEIKAIIDDAVTAEALAVTYLSGLVANASTIGIPANLVPVLQAANAAEYDHYQALTSLGAKPLTTKFWAPNAFFASSMDVFATLEVAETLFVNAYLIAVTAFAKDGKQTLARYAGEILGVEAEHRTLARFAQGKLPNDVGFESFQIHTIGGIVAALEHAGVGFGTQGATPGAFYTFSPPPASAVTQIENNSPA